MDYQPKYHFNTSSPGDPPPHRPWKQDRLFLAILGTALGLAVWFVFCYLRWGTGHALTEMPLYIPIMRIIAGLAALGVAFLGIRRYPMLRDRPSFWVSMGAAAFGILILVFYSHLARPPAWGTRNYFAEPQ